MKRKKTWPFITNDVLLIQFRSLEDVTFYPDHKTVTNYRKIHGMFIMKYRNNELLWKKKIVSDDFFFLIWLMRSDCMNNSVPLMSFDDEDETFEEHRGKHFERCSRMIKLIEEIEGKGGGEDERKA